MPNYPISLPVDNYYNRFDPAKNYEKVLARDGFRIQGAETNDMEEMFLHRVKSVADALFGDGDIIRDAQIVVDEETGAVQAGAGILYIDGGMRSVPAATLTIPVIGVVSIGIYRTETIVSELQDPSLRNPAAGTRGEDEPGAWRLKVDCAWGVYGDGHAGDYYPVYTVEDGILRAKEAPPNLDAFNQGIARYDRDSTAGGTYIVSGLVVRAADMTAGGNQSYTVSEGRARVWGYGIELPTSRRLVYEAIPDLRFIDTEIHTADGEPSQRIDVAHPPIAAVAQLRITRRKTVSIVHGAYSGASDALPDSSVVSLISVSQGGTVYVAGADYKKTGDMVDWSPAGAEPAPGSTYSVTYDYIVAVNPVDPDFDGFAVENAVAGSSIIVSYHQALPRVDRLCLTQEGGFLWLKGVAAEYNARAASPSDGVLALATVYQDWRGIGRVVNDGIRVMSFATLEALTERLDFALTEIARQRLEADVTTREAGARVGIFVDPLLNDEMRDQGITQSAAIAGGELLLPIAASIHALAAIDAVVVPDYTPVPVLTQPLRTGAMQVNPYMAFDVLPAQVTLDPAIDRWTEIQSNWTSPVTNIFQTGHFVPGRSTLTNQSTSGITETLGSETSALEFLRPIQINFTIEGFGPGETLRQVVFDGVEVGFSAMAANAQGVATGDFAIPANIPAGAKQVAFRGSGGSEGSAVFVGQGLLTVQTLRQVNTVVNYWVDPLAQTFVLDRTTQICGVDLWFTAKSGEVRIQIREVQSGVPRRVILAEAVVRPENIAVTGGNHTRVLFPAPVQLQGGSEYAIVVLANDPVTTIAVAEMGKFDSDAQRWVASQPYTVGVLLSSSNASTWTAHQDRDMTFRLLEARFNSTLTEVYLGTAELTDATDLLLFAVDERPTAATQVEYVLGLPDGSTITLDQGQPIRLPEPVSGPLGVSARLRGDASAAPLLWPGSQVLAGTVSASGDYSARSIAATGAVKAILIYDAVIPSGAGLIPEIQIDGGAWAPWGTPATVQQGDGLVEYSHSQPLFQAETIKLRFTLTGASQARPSVRNIRFLALK
ncbi:MAG: DUF4815 domain-containing protein [Desulfobulbus sp.]|nr:DUF4815 domain-containing protein [Desulfobulbus sp.]